MAQHTTSREMHTEPPNSGVTPERHLKLATGYLEQSQSMLSGNVQFHHGQCECLVKKLETALQSAMDCMSLSSPEQISVSMENWKLVVRLAMDVKSFVQECCKNDWIQAASMLMNAFEHVASLICHLELCIWSFRNRNRIILGTALRQELTNISQDQDRRLTCSQALDQVILLKKVEAALNLESISNPEEHQVATSLLERLEAAVANNPILDKPDLAALSVRDQADLLNKGEATLKLEIISSPEESRLATSLLGRLRIALANPTPHTPKLALLSSWEVEKKRLDQEQCSETSFHKRQLARLETALADPISDKPDLGQLSFMSVDRKSLKREKPLGKGPADDVFKVKWLGIYAAEKTFPDGKDLLFFDPEVSLLAKLSHPNIVPLLCYAKEEPECSIVLELMDKDLTKLIDERLKLDESSEFPFSTDEAIDIMLQIAEGMHYLYRKRVLHRDLKSHNILVKCVKLEEVDAEFVYAKVADFGISKTKEMSITLSHPTWDRAGTTGWMAPELIRVEQRGSAGSQTISSGSNNVSRYPFKSDVFSFGMVCYEILTGGAPFAGFTPNTVKKMVWRGDRPPLPSHCPSSLASMIKKCWRFEPKERPSFAEICTELRFMKGSLLIGRGL